MPRAGVRNEPLPAGIVSRPPTTSNHAPRPATTLATQPEAVRRRRSAALPELGNGVEESLDGRVVERFPDALPKLQVGGRPAGVRGGRNGVVEVVAVVVHLLLLADDLVGQLAQA